MTNNNAEQSVKALIGAALLSPEAMAQAALYVRPEYIANTNDRAIYTALLALYNGNKVIDYATLCDTLGGKIDELGGYGYIAQLISNVPSAANAMGYIAKIQEFARWDTFSSGMQTILNESPPDYAEHAKKVLNAIQGIGGGTINRVGSDALTAVLQLAEPTDKISTGYYNLDTLLGGGLCNGQLCIIGARTAQGKTALALNLAYKALKAKRTVVVFSLEMQQTEIIQRLAAIRSAISFAEYRNGESNAVERMNEAALWLSEKPLFISDTAHTMERIKAQCYEIKKTHSPDMVFVDYLQLIQPTVKQNRNREQEVAEISRNLKILAQELNVPVIVPSQLNRGAENRTEDKPKLSDLRESGSIEQDADICLLLSRNETHADLRVAKNRNGRNGTIQMVYKGNTFTFTEESQRQPTFD